MSRRDITLAAHTAAIAVLAGLTAALGVFGRGGGQIASATSIRGERFDYVTDGIYAYNPVRVVAEGIGWDVVTLFGVAPALLVVSWLVARGSLRGRLAATGLLGYVVYQYLMYAMFWAIGPLFPAFVLLYPLAIWGIVRLIAATDLDDLATRLGPGFPRRATAWYSLAMALLLVGMWVPRISTALAGDLAGAGLLGTPTLVVQALDLGIVVPLALAAAWALWRRHRAAAVLAALLMVKGVSMAVAIMAMLVSAWQVEGRLEVVPFAIFAVAAGFAGWLAARVLVSVRPAAGAGSVLGQALEQDVVAVASGDLQVGRRVAEPDEAGSLQHRL